MKLRQTKFWKKVCSQIGKNYQRNTVGEKLIWNNVKKCKVTKNTPNLIQNHKTSHADVEYKVLDTKYNLRGPIHRQDVVVLEPAYRDSPAIPFNKKDI